MSIGRFAGSAVGSGLFDDAFELLPAGGAVRVADPAADVAAEVRDCREHAVHPVAGPVVGDGQQADVDAGGGDRLRGFLEAQRVVFRPFLVGGRAGAVTVLVAVGGLVAELDRLDRQAAVGAVGPEGAARPECLGPAGEVLRFGGARHAAVERGQRGDPDALGCVVRDDRFERRGGCADRHLDADDFRAQQRRAGVVLRVRPGVDAGFEARAPGDARRRGARGGRFGRRRRVADRHAGRPGTAVDGRPDAVGDGLARHRRRRRRGAADGREGFGLPRHLRQQHVAGDSRHEVPGQRLAGGAKLRRRLEVQFFTAFSDRRRRRGRRRCRCGRVGHLDGVRPARVARGGAHDVGHGHARHRRRRRRGAVHDRVAVADAGNLGDEHVASGAGDSGPAQLVAHGPEGRDRVVVGGDRGVTAGPAGASRQFPLGDSEGVARALHGSA